MQKGTDEAKNQMGHFMLDIKEHCNMKIKRVSGTVGNVQDCLSHYGFESIYHDFAHFGGDKHDEKHLDGVVKMLEKEKPVVMLAFCIAGWPWEWCGHAYVIDGYLKNKEGEYFHINWGWNGIQDGYYARGCFDENYRDSIEEGLDSGEASCDPSNFNVNHYYVHYEL